MPKHKQQTCRCPAYSFPHRLHSGQCSKTILQIDTEVEEQDECVCFWNPSLACPIHGEYARKGLDFNGNKPQKTAYGRGIGWWG